MTLGSILSEVAAEEKTVVVYSPDDTGEDLAERLATRNLHVDHRKIPSISADAFVVVRDGSRFRGALSLSDLLVFLSPPIHRPEDLDSVDAAYRALFELLDQTVFVTLDRRQLLATSREIEDRAWRTGRGRLHVGFQSVAAFEAQAGLYRDLAATTDVDVHVYVPAGAPSGYLDDAPLTAHTDVDEDLARYWFILFDGRGEAGLPDGQTLADDGTESTQSCALIAEATGPDCYRGVWTYDPDRVARAFEAVT
ncbi:hypothetical protein NDI85_15965 [Halomicroarcula sp. S1AR25-4]|uniref:DICT sensory domain-containing protein n=1 Tax=Haloarcula sp. S1AR25-4 TaxID=2950538 RepID=UPI0028761ED8|nr:DICT sensory domain-containing protein [Halomicroarcula sp. S1AR25-4]MDS0279298.1 hypothetical protein [Halomicroarcula sp. S1AR25-4]